MSQTNNLIATNSGWDQISEGCFFVPAMSSSIPILHSRGFNCATQCFPWTRQKQNQPFRTERVKSLINVLLTIEQVMLKYQLCWERIWNSQHTHRSKTTTTLKKKKSIHKHISSATGGAFRTTHSHTHCLSHTDTGAKSLSVTKQNTNKPKKTVTLPIQSSCFWIFFCWYKKALTNDNNSNNIIYRAPQPVLPSPLSFKINRCIYKWEGGMAASFGNNIYCDISGIFLNSFVIQNNISQR